jgi:hypothetical protein
MALCNKVDFSREFMKERKIFILISALFGMAPTGYGQGTIAISFDGPPLQPPGTAYNIQSYFESGMSFSPLSGSVGFGRVWSDPVPARPDNGTPYLQAAAGQSLMFDFGNDSPFELTSIDLAEYSTVVPDAVTVSFIGYHPDGSTISTSFTTDGIIDGTGPLADFQTFNFGPGWTDLTRVEIPTDGWSLDNLVVSIPEPGTGALFVVGALVFQIRRIQRRK